MPTFRCARADRETILGAPAGHVHQGGYVRLSTGAMPRRGEYWPCSKDARGPGGTGFCASSERRVGKTMDVRDLAGALWRRRLLVLLVWLITGLAVAAGLWLAPKSYTATATIAAAKDPSATASPEELDELRATVAAPGHLPRRRARGPGAPGGRPEPGRAVRVHPMGSGCRTRSWCGSRPRTPTRRSPPTSPTWSPRRWPRRPSAARRLHPRDQQPPPEPPTQVLQPGPAPGVRRSARRSR